MCSLSASVYRHQVHHAPPFLPFPLSPIQATEISTQNFKKCCFIVVKVALVDVHPCIFFICPSSVPSLSFSPFLQFFGAFLCQQPEQQTPLRRAAHVAACQPQVLLPSSSLHHQDVLAQPPPQAFTQHPHHHGGQGPGPGCAQLFSQRLCKHALYHVTLQ